MASPLLERQHTPFVAQSCDDCGKPLNALGMVLYNVHGPFPGPTKLESNFYSADLTVREIGGYIETRRIYCDAAAQRGQKEGGFPRVPEYCLADDVPKGYVVDYKRVEEMVHAMEDATFFGGALTWNLRPGEAHWHYDRTTETLSVSSDTRVYLPDSHHRHLAMKLGLQLIRENRLKPDVGNKSFTVNIYVMPRLGEAQLFYEYNVLGKHAESTRAYVLSQTDPISKIVRELIDHPPFQSNVETVTNRLSKSSAKMVTFGTLHDSIRDARRGAPGKAEDEVAFYSRFFGLLSRARTEIGTLSAAERNRVRSELMVDQAVMFHAYVRLAEHVRVELEAAKIPADGERVWEDWARRLEKLRAPNSPRKDLFTRVAPLWQQKGVIRPSRSGGLVVANTRDTRQIAYELLRDYLGVEVLKSAGVDLNSAEG